MFLPIQSKVSKCKLDETSKRDRVAGCNYKVLRPWLLEHPPHGVYIFLRPPPVTLDIQIAQFDLRLHEYVVDHGEKGFAAGAHGLGVIALLVVEAPESN